MERAQETAHVIAKAHGLTSVVEDAFCEFDFGKWTGKTFSELEHLPERVAFNTARDRARAPGGESMLDVQNRAIAGLEPLISGAYRGQTVAIVSHGDVIRALLLHAVNASLAGYWRLSVDAASISELDCYPDGVRAVIRMNDCAHLEVLSRDNL